MHCHLHPGQVGHHNRKSFLAGGSVGLLFCWWRHIVAASFLDFVANAAFVVGTVVVIHYHMVLVVVAVVVVGFLAISFWFIPGRA